MSSTLCVLVCVCVQSVIFRYNHNGVFQFTSKMDCTKKILASFLKPPPIPPRPPPLYFLVIRFCKFTFLLGINQLTGTIPTEIGQLTKLTYLQVCKFSTLQWNSLVDCLSSILVKFAPRGSLLLTNHPLIHTHLCHFYCFFFFSPSVRWLSLFLAKTKSVESIDGDYPIRNWSINWIDLVVVWCVLVEL